MEIVHRYCTYNTLLNAGVGLGLLEQEIGGALERDMSGIVLTRPAKEYKPQRSFASLANGGTFRRCNCLYSERKCLTVLR